MTRPAAAIVTVGTELTLGLQLDTNAPEIATALTIAGLHVSELASVPDDAVALTGLLKRLIDLNALVVVTGGLGPTHDDITREAAAAALSRPLVRDEGIIATSLEAVTKRHRDAEAAAHVFRMADAIDGATVLPAVVGTAPGQIAAYPGGHLVLLPGPPREMRPLLAIALGRLGLSGTSQPVVLCTTGLSESDIQVRTQRVLGDTEGIGFTVLAKPGEVRVVLVDTGAGDAILADAAQAVAAELDDVCFSTTGETLPEAVVRTARAAGVTIATAESCTGGLVSAALTDVPGASDVFLGGVVSYSNELKTATLGVDEALLDAHGAVSAETAGAMAAGARRLTGADIAVAVTGVAGPGGGTPEKPVGTVWFGIASAAGGREELRTYPGDRTTVRTRATAHALDLLRREASSAR